MPAKTAAKPPFNTGGNHRRPAGETTDKWCKIAAVPPVVTTGAPPKIVVFSAGEPAVVPPSLVTWVCAASRVGIFHEIYIYFKINFTLEIFQ